MPARAADRSRAAERQRRRDRARPSARLHRRQADDVAALRDAAAQGALRTGHDVRRRRHGRRRHLRTAVDECTECTDKPASTHPQRRLVAARGHAAGRRLHAGEADRRASADGADDRTSSSTTRCCRTSIASRAKDWELARSADAPRGELGLLGIERARRVRRPRPRQGLVARRRRTHRARRRRSRTTFGGQANLCILPLVLFGTDDAESSSTCRSWSPARWSAPTR